MLNPTFHPRFHPGVDDAGGLPTDTVFMTFTDYALDITLIALVLLQVRPRRVTARTLLLPLGIVAWAAATYLKGVPTAGNDLVLVVGCAAIGALLGGLCAAFTTVGRDASGAPVAKAGAVAAVLWVLGVGTRLAFQLYVSHGGSPAVVRFSAAHHITSSEAWTAALVLMAIAEVVARSAGIIARAYRAQPVGAAAAPAPPPRAMMGTGDNSF